MCIALKYNPSQKNGSSTLSYFVLLLYPFPLKEYYDTLEINRIQTAKARMRELQATEPSEAEDIVAFVIFLKSIWPLPSTFLLNMKSQKVC